MEKPLRIMIIEDSADDALLLVRELTRGGYAPHYRVVDTAAAMRAALAGEEWDAITSDYNMPRFSALEALKVLQESGLDIPFILLSGKIGEDLAVAAMKAGAHDYVMKNNLSRLVPAIEREIREAAERRKRRQAEIALHKQFNQISTIFDSMNAIIYVADLESDALLYMNKYATAIFGEGWLGKPCTQVVRGGGQLPCALCTPEQLTGDGRGEPPRSSEYQSPATGRWYQCLERVIEWTDGRPVRLEIAVDISERKEMERLKDEMISAVSHEMRTPLTAMIGFTEFLLENEVSREQLTSYLSTIQKESERLNELIGNFLDLQKMKSRLESYRFGAVPVAPLLRDAVALFTGERSRHRFEVDCRPDIPPVRGDEGKLFQVLTNLITNACKYSPAGTRVVVGARLEGEEIVIWVRDEGMGIPAGLREKIFEKFFRVDNTDRRRVGGTGLGLALVREIVAAHGGRVWVESEEGKGSTFYFALPVSGCD